MESLTEKRMEKQMGILKVKLMAIAMVMSKMIQREIYLKMVTEMDSVKVKLMDIH